MYKKILLILILNYIQTFLANMTEQVNRDQNDDDRILDEDSVVHYSQYVSDTSEKDVNNISMDSSRSNMITPDKTGTHYFY